MSRWLWGTLAFLLGISLAVTVALSGPRSLLAEPGETASQGSADELGSAGGGEAGEGSRVPKAPSISADSSRADAGAVALAGEVPSTISYQGRLTDAGGNPLQGNHGMRFQLWNHATDGAQVGADIVAGDVSLDSGLFTVALPVSQAAFNGQGLWLRAQVDGQWLTPRQELLPAPYALGLKPGATIEGADAGAVFSVVNTSSIGQMGQVTSAARFTSGHFYGVYGIGPSGGVYGDSAAGRGVTGLTTSGTGVWGLSTASGYGIRGEVRGAGYAVYGLASGQSTESRYAGYFEAQGDYDMGIVARAGRFGHSADLHGPVMVRSYGGNPVVELGEGLDYAEGFLVSDKAGIAPGAVLIIDPDQAGRLTLSREAYDRKVAGIVAGAQGLGSGIRLGASQYDYDVALAGRVYCNVDATEAAVAPGDLLTTSDRPGHAMRVTEPERAAGAILGKAMESLDQGATGQILVLVTLQ